MRGGGRKGKGSQVISGVVLVIYPMSLLALELEVRAVNMQPCIHLYAHAVNLKFQDNFQETHTEH